MASSSQVFAKTMPNPAFFSDKIAVIVNNQVITENELKQRMLLMQKMMHEQGQVVYTDEEMRDDVMELLIVELLQRNEAMNLGVSLKEVDWSEIVDDFARQRNMTIDQMKQDYFEQGILWESVLQKIKADFLHILFLRSEHLGKHITVNSDEIDDFITKNSLDLKSSEDVRSIVQQRLLNAKIEKEIIRDLSKLRGQAYVEYKMN